MILCRLKIQLLYIHTNKMFLMERKLSELGGFIRGCTWFIRVQMHNFSFFSLWIFLSHKYLNYWINTVKKKVEEKISPFIASMSYLVKLIQLPFSAFGTCIFSGWTMNLENHSINIWMWETSYELERCSSITW